LIEAKSLQEIIHQVGRGAKGARPLDQAQAAQLFGAMLDGAIPELELGALLLAYRIKGETSDELNGFIAACTQRSAAVSAPDNRPLVVIPSYNGARHLPNLVPLLAMRLRDAGVAVLVHGVSTDPKRVTSAQVFAALGVAAASDAAHASRALAEIGLAFITIDTLHPPLAKLLALRWRLGVRSSAHSVAKIMQPATRCALQLVNVTHPEYLVAMREYFTRYQASVMLLRGTEGEAVAHARRAQAVEWLRAGESGTVSETVIEAVVGSVTDLPALPVAIDAESTARWIERALAGQVPLPDSISAQVEAIVKIARIA
jgi:anthranilate phosphoribosyltransferase